MRIPLNLCSFGLLMASPPTRTPPVYEGCWSDPAGMALFEVNRQDSTYWVRNAMGALPGSLKDGRLQGKTGEGEAFTLSVRGDTAEYSVMGLTMSYQRISRSAYDSLQKKMQP